MARTTKIVGFSLPPEIYKQVERLSKSKHKTRSEFIREMIDVYFNYSNKQAVVSEPIKLEEIDFAKVLKSYWLLKSQTSLKTITIGLGIIVDEDKVLIGARKTKDRWVEGLTWVFPGGNLNSLDFAEDLKNEIRQETGLEVKVNSLITARVHPDSGFKNVQIVALYFYCSPTKRQVLKVGGDLKKLKWVRPNDVFRYFTTSTCDDVTKFLSTIHKATRK